MLFQILIIFCVSLTSLFSGTLIKQPLSTPCINPLLPTESLSDSELLLNYRLSVIQKDFKQRDELFEQINNRFRNKLIAFAKRAMDMDHNAAEDLVQDLFLKIWQLPPDQLPTSISFFYEAIKNRTVDSQRSPWSKRKKDIELKDFGVENKDLINLEEKLDRIASFPKLITVLLSIHPKDYEILVLKASGFTHKEIAEMLNMPEGTVKTNHRRGLQTAKKLTQDPHELESKVHNLENWDFYKNLSIEEELKLPLAFSLLTDIQREIIIEKALFGKTFPQLAHELKIPQDTLESRFSFAKKQLKETLKQLCEVKGENPIQMLRLEQLEFYKTLKPEQKMLFLKALWQLPQEQKDIIVYKTIENKTFQEIAKKLNISEEAAQSRYYYAKSKLEKILTSLLNLPKTDDLTQTYQLEQWPFYKNLNPEQRELFPEALKRLSDIQREAIELRYMKNKTKEEIATQLKVPVTTLEGRLSDARENLTEILPELLATKNGTLLTYRLEKWELYFNLDTNQRQHFMSILETLSDKQKEVIKLRHIDNKTLPEIATALNQDLTTIKGRYYEGVRALKATLSRFKAPPAQ